MMNSKAALLTMCFLLIILAGRANDPPPNFILILTDDHGWTSTSTAMDKHLPNSKSDYYETPHIDRLAATGMRFSHGYAPAAICTPTRRSILYGQSAPRQGPKDGFEEKYHPAQHDFLTIPLMLKEADSRYRTAHFGKWHILGNFFPEDVGYDESDGKTTNSGGNMWEHKSDKWMKTFFSGDPKKVNHITERGMNFISRNVRAGNPFYLQLSHYATHVDIQSREETYDKYSKKKRGEAHDHPGMAGMLEHLDEGIGRLLDHVEALGISDNTYIILMSDNGGAEFIPPSGNKLDHPDNHGRKQRNYPLRGGKWVLYEGGIRVPFIVKGPGIAPGTQCDVPVVGYDILPTLADIVGYPGKMPEYVDGGSFKTLLAEGKGTVKRPYDAMVFHRFVGYYPHSAIIMGDYKLLKFWKSSGWREKGIELYNIKSDLGEINDISGKMPEKCAQMEKKMIEYMRSVNTELLHELEAMAQ